MISLKCVEHKTKPKKTATCKIKNVKTPLFHAASFSISKEYIYILRAICIYEKTKI